MPVTAAAPLPTLVRVAEEDRLLSSSRELQRRARSGSLRRLRAGAYVDAAEWAALGWDEQQMMRIAAVIGSRRDRPVLFGPSAAIVLGLPLVGIGDTDVHLLAWGGAAPPSGNGVRWHRDRVDEASIIEIGGMLVTDVKRTVLDLARRFAVLHSIASVDRALSPALESSGFECFAGLPRLAEPVRLAGVERAELLDALAAMPGARGVGRARRTVAFADAAAMSPGESISRAQMELLGFPRPRLQVRFARIDGDGEDVVDFDWPEYGLIGEFDGKVKYTRAEYLGDRDVTEVVWDEKLRERRLKRGHGREAARWVWDDTIALAEGMRRELRSSGLPQIPRARRLGERE
ncbi:hypothetical protein ACWKWP_14535 [Agromyces soli]